MATTSPDLPRTHELHDGTTIPAIGFGTYPLRGDDGIEAITSAITAGYRLVDTAVNYENEREVGEAIRRAGAEGIDRDELVVQSKIPGRDHAYDKAVASVEGSLERLGLDRLDVGLIHWPNPSVGLFPEAWRALVDCRERGLVRSIGVSNFTPQHLARTIDESGVTPVVNQVELHPLFPQAELRAEHERLGIRTESWSPLGKREAPFGADPVADAAAAHGVSPAQVILRWQLQLGAIPLPKSGTPERQRANLDVFGFALTDEQMDAISGLGRADGRLFDGDPETHEEM
ncbi:diketogulonate reductase-like aldo/keto reductase [Knoellia remsis]|uniref:Diketogulonate reductase-like aldo/keto reductase n=1 Tax=Knoellia remsis TaxID=407159 RepID=A0A2T0UN49_9MICO|nr:aldo/keto reductase [Knoellia remsis]PRY59267.1 diketogulonate reductase-like aldo/keto reductase [Knoellia remsis]